MTTPLTSLDRNRLYAEVDTAEEALRSAMLAADVAALDGLIDDDLLFVGPDGSLLSKAADLDVYRSGEQRITTLEIHERDLRVRDALASVAVVARVAGVYRGQAFEGRFRYLRVWHASTSGWKVVAGSVSPRQG